MVCNNYKYAAEVLKVPNMNFNHFAYDKNYAAYHKIYKDLEQKINYPFIYSLQK